MKIETMRIQNFRTLRDVSVKFDSITTFIGPNGVGKSTILRALDWFFNGVPGGITDSDCYLGRSENGIEVEVTFDGLTDADREALGSYTPPGANKFTAWKRRGPDGVEVLSANVKGFPAFNNIKISPNIAEKKKRFQELRSLRPELEIGDAKTGAAIDEAMRVWESSHSELLEDVPEALQTNFFGFNSNGKMNGLFDFVLVTADLRASEETVDAKASIIGRILERSVDRSAADEKILKIFEESQRQQRETYDNEFKGALNSITSELNQVVTSYSPGRKISVIPSEIELKPPKTTFNVSVLDGEVETPIDRQGHGFQRTLLISALQVLAESGAAASEGVICLAIEEPELFQHPVQAQAFAKVLRSLAENPERRMQVTYATHSPYFLEDRHFDQVRRLTRSSKDMPEVSITSSTLDDVKYLLAGVVDPAQIERQLDRVLENQLSTAVFANRVLLVEGATEMAVFHGIGDRESVGLLESEGTVVVPAGSKISIPLVHATLESMGVPTFTLFDGDSGFESRAVAKGKNVRDVRNERAGHVAGNRTLLRYYGLMEADFPDEQIADNVAVFSDHLETFLAAEWSEWGDSCNRFEQESGITLGKNQSAYRAATMEAGGVVPSMLSEILEKVRSL